MKKVLLAILILVIAGNVKAQKGSMANPTTFSIGVEASIPTGTFNTAGYNFGIGGSVQLDQKVAPDLALTLNGGYLNYSNKNAAPYNYHFSVIPLLAGIKFWVSPKVYLSGQLGAAFNSAKYSNGGGTISTSTGFAYSPGVGFNITRGLDLLVKYFGNSVSGGTFSSFGGRLAYTIGK